MGGVVSGAEEDELELEEDDELELDELLDETELDEDG